MSIKKTNVPNPELVIALMAGAPVSILLNGGEQYKPKKAYPTEKEVASLLRITPYQVRRVVNAWKSGGIQAARDLKWGAGRPLKSMNFSQEEIEDIVSRPTMYK
jgi:transposase